MNHKPTFTDSEGYKIKCPYCYMNLRRMLFRIGAEVKDGNRVLCENNNCLNTSILATTTFNNQFRLEKIEL